MKAVSAQSLSIPASKDEMVLSMWLHGRQPKTVLAYRADATRFLAFVATSLDRVSLADLQAYALTLDGLAHATKARRLAAVKSLFRFAHRLGAIPLDPATALKIERPQVTTAERILSKEDVARMIGAEPDARRRTALRLLYLTGIRAAELCALRWRDLTGTDRKGGEARVLGKGSKLRIVTIPPDLWRDLSALSSSARPDAPVLPGRDGAPLTYAALHRIVKRAAKRIGLPDQVSAHFLRHSSASHSLDSGAPIHVVQQALGHASLTTTTRYVHAKRGDSLAGYLRA